MTPEKRELIETGAGIGSVWTAVGISNWAEAGAAAATIYTVMLALWFLWRRIVRPFLEDMGWKQPRKRRITDFQDSD